MTDLAERPATEVDAGGPPARAAASRPVTDREPSRLRRPQKRGRSLRAIATGTFAAIVVLILAAVGIMMIGLFQLSDAVDVQTKQYGPAVIRANNAFAGLLNQETGVRGYAITADDSYLDPYTQGLTDETSNIAQLRGVLPASDTATRTATDDLVAAADAWRAKFAQPAIAATKAGDRDQVRALLQGAQGKTLFDDVRAAYSTLNADVGARRTEAVNKVRSSVTLLITTTSIAAAVVLIAAVVVWVGVRRRIIVPVARLASESRKVAGGRFDYRVSGGGPVEIDDLAQDVDAMRNRIVGELAEVDSARALSERTAASLARSNADLEQFAYVASHDLQEPLRKVSNFCQLLERQYASQLDDRAGQYIHFAVDGAKRMQNLINDLLSFSRVGRNTDSFVDVSLADVVRDALDNLAEPLRDTGGLVHVGSELPTLPGDRTLLVTLLQNLIGNALKYHGDEVPRVEVTASRRVAQVPAGIDDSAPRHEWVVTVADNGIGIEPQYAQRIFVIFQRLHLRDSYGGTGIGLAMCKKIVEFHGGTIWLESPRAATADTTPHEPAPHTGARFSFTLPEGLPPI